MTALKENLKKITTDPTLLLVIFFAFFTNGMMSTMLGAILPFMKTDYDMSYTLSGLVLSAHQTGNLFSCFIAGVLPYLLGRKKSTIGLGAGIFIGMMMMTLTGNPLLLVIAFVFTGIGRGTMSNISNVVVSEITTDKTKSLNLLHAIFAVGAFLAPFIAMLVTSVPGLTWRVGAWLVALLALAILFVFSGSTLSGQPTPRTAKESGESFLSSFRFWLCTGILFFYICVEATAVGWLVTYFKDSGIMSTALAQVSSSILWIMILFGRLLCATFSGRFRKQGLVVAMSVLMAVFYIVMISTTNQWIIFPALMGLGVSMAGLYPTTLSCMDSRFTSSTAAMGTCMSVSTLGGIVMPAIVGVIAENSTITGGMAAISVTMIILVVLTMINHLTSR